MVIVPGIVAGFGPPLPPPDPPPPPPPFEMPTTGLLYWFDAADAESAAGVPAVAADPVAVWPNKGSAEDAEQPTSARRPIFRTGGLEGFPYLECDRTAQQYFADLAFSQPSGTTAADLNPYSLFFVIDALGPLANTPSIIGNSASSLGKMNLYFRPTVNEQYRISNLTAFFSNVPAGPLIIHGAVVNPGGSLRRRLIANGVLEMSGSGGALDTNANSATQFLRNSILSSGGFFDGRIYEFLLWSRELTPTEVRDVGDSLAAKYGVATSSNGDFPWQYI